jgi:hypothetical protein
VDADALGSSGGRQTDPGLVEGTAKEASVTGDTEAAQGSLFRELSPTGREWIKWCVSRPMQYYTQRYGKRLYVDKSLDSVFSLALTHELFPDARYVILVRHVMDTVASGLEASPWGFNAYGYGPYVQNSPGNAVAALANYWLAHVTAATEWEAQHPECCHRIRYEDLVVRPQETIAEVQQFLGVEADLSVLTKAFERDVPPGPGDYKVPFTTSIDRSSIGHGKRVPVAMLPPRLLEALNERLAALEYSELTRAWNAEERVDGSGGNRLWASRLTELMEYARRSGLAGSGLIDEAVALVAEDDRALRWVIDPDTNEISQGDAEVSAVLTGTAEDLVLMLSGQANLGALLRSGRIRHLAANETDSPHEVAGVFSRLVKFLARGPAEVAPHEQNV